MDIIQKVKNLVQSADLSWGKDYPGGYHTLRLGGRKDFEIKGQRNPSSRVELMPELDGKSVLDIGCNSGGILRTIAETYDIEWSVGIDYNSQLINVANMITGINGTECVDFYTFDLQKQPLDLIKNFLTDDKVHVCILMSMCIHLPNWKEVVNFASEVSEGLIFESNGSFKQQEEQLDYVSSKYNYSQCLANNSEDDEIIKNRKLFHFKDKKEAFRAPV